MECAFLGKVNVDHSIVLHGDIGFDGGVREVEFGVVIKIPGTEIHICLVGIDAVEEIISSPDCKIPPYRKADVGGQSVHDASGNTYPEMVEKPISLFLDFRSRFYCFKVDCFRVDCD